jgi:hypothetical protein
LSPSSAHAAFVRYRYGSDISISRTRPGLGPDDIHLGGGQS